VFVIHACATTIALYCAESIDLLSLDDGCDGPQEAEAVRRFLEQAIPRATSDVIAAYSAALEGEGVRSKEDLLELPDDVVVRATWSWRCGAPGKTVFFCVCFFLSVFVRCTDLASFN
jgi:hypothetical protein